MKKENSWIKVLGNKRELALKQYEIIALGIFIAKIDLKKAEETKKKIVTQNASICAKIKIKSIFGFLY